MTQDILANRNWVAYHIFWFKGNKTKNINKTKSTSLHFILHYTPILKNGSFFVNRLSAFELCTTILVQPRKNYHCEFHKNTL
jgi:hypothetical protein